MLRIAATNPYIEATVSLVVADTLGLPELIIGWVDLQRWGILRLEEGEVSRSRNHGVFAVTSAAQDFLNKQTVYPPRRSFQEIDPCDPLCSEDGGGLLTPS